MERGGGRGEEGGGRREEGEGGGKERGEGRERRKREREDYCMSDYNFSMQKTKRQSTTKYNCVLRYGTTYSNYIPSSLCDVPHACLGFLLCIHS